MSKELVISSNRHETKVAILEDDQLVEVFFQRSNEYSLAGSIHKGRVTRVLPGMQSAFVDLGLERDTFLYVSDFFEENGDDIDRVAEEPRPVVHTAPPPEPEPAVAEAAAPTEKTEEGGDNRERRGRRSRRRRNRGRGFPESKYASPQAAREDAPEEAAEEVAEVPEETAPEPIEVAPEAHDFAVLPGESLAKYRAAPAAEPQDEISAQADEEDEETLPPDVSVIANDIAEEQPPANAIPDAPVHRPVEAAAESAVAPPVESEPEPEPEPEPTEEPAFRANVDDEDREIQALIFEGDADESSPAEESPESASATVRADGSRYHRSGRRMRRRNRGDAPPQQPQAQAPPARQEPRAERAPMPSISDLLNEGQEILVQIAKEPLGQKGARITSHIALPGRYVVYMPTLDHMGVSRKIASDEERQRLKKILQKARAGLSGGFIVRTAGEGRSEDEISNDMSFLANLWLDIRQKAEKRPAPALLHHDLDIVQRILRDQVNDSFKAVWVDSEEAYERIVGFFERLQPSIVSRVKLYTREAPIFDAFGITTELEKALRPKVWLKSGGYIVINQTEALVAIDVNTGKFVGKSNRLEDTIVKTNMEAVKEIVRQVRLRDLGGIIVIDFIDMEERKNRQKVMQTLEEAMRQDRAPYKILQFNDFGLVAVTRKRVKQSLERTLCSPCPYCEGAGYVKSVQTVIGEILQEAHKIARAVDGQNVVLRVNPDVAKVLKSNHNRYLEELEEILKRPVLVSSDASIHHEKFDLA